MATEWQAYDVSRLIEDGALLIGDGYRAKNDELSATGVPFARAGNINDGFRFDDADHFPEADLSRLGNKISQPGDVVFTSKGTVGRFAFVREGTARFVYSPQLCFWRSLDVTRIEPRFLFYWMFGREFFVQFKGVAGQTDMAEYVSLGDQRRMRITLPPVSEQRAIAHILGTLDDKIEVNRRMSATLEAMARALFKSWFVDFEPVRAKADGRDPGLPPHLAALFPDRLVETEVGEVPEGWRLGTLAAYADLNPEVWSKRTRPEEIKYIDLSNAKWGHIETITPHKRDDAPSRAQRVLRPDDTIVGTVRPGNGSFAFISEEGLTGSTGFAQLRPRSSNAAEFVYLAATSTDNIEALAHIADGAAYPAVQPEVVAATPAVTAPGRVVDAFAHHSRPLLGKIAQNGAESRTLAALRDALLPKLISGKLRVKDAERFLASAT